MTKAAALHKPENYAGFASGLGTLDNHSTAGWQIGRQMLQDFAKKPFAANKCRAGHGRYFKEERFQRPILVVDGCNVQK